LLKEIKCPSAMAAPEASDSPSEMGLLIYMEALYEK